MRIGLAQINPTVGDLGGNRDKILGAYHRLVEAGAELVVFPELAVTGYPPKDLLLQRRYLFQLLLRYRNLLQLQPQPLWHGPFQLQIAHHI